MLDFRQSVRSTPKYCFRLGGCEFSAPVRSGIHLRRNELDDSRAGNERGLRSNSGSRYHSACFGRVPSWVSRAIDVAARRQIPFKILYNWKSNHKLDVGGKTNESGKVQHLERAPRHIDEEIAVLHDLLNRGMWQSPKSIERTCIRVSMPTQDGSRYEVASEMVLQGPPQYQHR